MFIKILKNCFLDESIINFNKYEFYWFFFIKYLYKKSLWKYAQWFDFDLLILSGIDI